MAASDSTSSSSTSFLSSTPPSPSDEVAVVLKHLRGCRKQLYKHALPPASEIDRRLISLAVSVLGSDNLEAKECALDLLASLATIGDFAEFISTCLATQTDASFETAFLAVATLDSATAEPLESSLLMLLLRLSGYEKFSAADLLEATTSSSSSTSSSSPSSSSLAVDTILALLRSPAQPKHMASDTREIHVACARLLYEMTLPETYFRAVAAESMSSSSPSIGSIVSTSSSSSSILDTNAIPIEKLTSIFTGKVNEFIEYALEKPIFQSIISLIKPWVTVNTAMKALMKQPPGNGLSSKTDCPASASADDILDVGWHDFMGHVLEMSHNLLLFSTEYGTKLRQHIAVTTGFMAEIVLPYTRMCIAAITAVHDTLVGIVTNNNNEEGNQRNTEELEGVLRRLLSSLRCAVSLLSVACYKIRILRPALRDGVLVTSALAVAPIAQDMSTLAALTQLTVNADMLLKLETSLGSSSSASSSSTSSTARFKPGGKKKSTFGPTASPGNGAASPGGGGMTTGGGSGGGGGGVVIGVNVNYALSSLLSNAVENLDVDARLRYARRIQEGENNASPLVSTGSSYDMLKDLWLVDASRPTYMSTSSSTSSSSDHAASAASSSSSSSSSSGADVAPLAGREVVVHAALANPAASSCSSDSKLDETTRTVMEDEAESKVQDEKQVESHPHPHNLPSSFSVANTTNISSNAMGSGIGGGRVPHHLPPLRRAKDIADAITAPLITTNNPLLAKNTNSDFFAPRCALTGKILNDPVIILVPSSVSSSVTTTDSKKGNLIRSAAPGAFTVPYYSPATEKKKEHTSNTTASDSKGGGREEEGGGGDCVAYYCERDAAEDAVEAEEENGPLVCPFTGKPLLGGKLVECRKGDPVVKTINQWQMRRMMSK